MTTTNDDAPSSCPDNDTSRRFGEGRLPAEQARLVSGHVALCPRCQARPEVGGPFAQTLPTALPPAGALGAARTVAASEGLWPGPPPSQPAASGGGQGMLARGAVVGRYVVLEPIGAGGMGVVYAAYDPELDRRVAVKLLRESDFARGSASEGQARLLREAQALAQLSHPHVVAVYDAGRASGSVFLAMEFVDGETLREWLRAGARPLEAKLEVFCQAGAGLSAAHSAGLVHRDFKPDNVLIDRQGRARVLDFGLARAAGDLGGAPAPRPPPGETGAPDLGSAPLTRMGTLMGTPLYMSPEQLRCEAATTRSDQFSFCVALFEALYGAMPFGGASLAEIGAAIERGPLLPPGAPVPAWLERAVRRGLCPSPDQRFASMDALLGELGRDPRARRRLRLSAALGATVLLATAAAGVGYARRRPPEAPSLCGAADRRLEGVWDGPRRAQTQAAFLATGKPFAAAAFDSVAAELDRYSAAWVAMDVQACEAARARGHEAESIHELRSTCLEHRVQELRALTDTFLSADRGVVARAPAAARSLSPVARCGDLEQLSAAPPPPVDAGVRQRVSHIRSKLTDAHALLAAGRHAEALKSANEALVQARQISYPPVLAEGLLARGRVLRAEGELAGAEEAFEGAAQAALAGRDDESLVRAMTELVSLVGVTLERPAEGKRWGRLADGVMQRVKNRALEADLDEATGRLLEEQGLPEEACARLGRSLTLRQQLGLKGAKLSDIRRRLGSIALRRGRLDEALGYQEQALADLEATLGPDHPQLVAPLDSLGLIYRRKGEYDRALGFYERALRILERSQGPEHPDIATMQSNLVGVYSAAGRYDEALAFERRVLVGRERSLGPDHPSLGAAYLNLGATLRDRGDFGAARPALERALAIEEKAFGPEHAAVGSALLQLGALAHQQHEYPTSEERLKRAARVLEHGAAGSSDLAASLAELGWLYLDEQRPARALGALERTRAMLTEHPGDPGAAAAVEATLGRARWELGLDRSAALEAVRAARTVLVAAGAGARRPLAATDAWLAARRK